MIGSPTKDAVLAWFARARTPPPPREPDPADDFDEQVDKLVTHVLEQWPEICAAAERASGRGAR